MVFCGQVCVYGQSTKNNLIALVIPDEVAGKKWARENGVEDMAMENLVKNKEFRKDILTEVLCGLFNDFETLTRLNFLWHH